MLTAHPPSASDRGSLGLSAYIPFMTLPTASRGGQGGDGLGTSNGDSTDVVFGGGGITNPLPPPPTSHSAPHHLFREGGFCPDGFHDDPEIMLFACIYLAMKVGERE